MDWEDFYLVSNIYSIEGAMSLLEAIRIKINTKNKLFPQPYQLSHLFTFTGVSHISHICPQSIDSLIESIHFTFKSANMFDAIFGSMHIGTILWLYIRTIIPFKPLTTLKRPRRIRSIANMASYRRCYLNYFLKIINKINEKEKFR